MRYKGSGGDGAYHREMIEALEYEEEKIRRRFARYLGAVATGGEIHETSVAVSPHPFTLMSDFEIQALGNDVY